MSDQISISKTLSIRDCGLDEFWLKNQIAADPGILGLGDLELSRRERQQSSGGRLDMLLKNPEDDSMYEVEVMLGGTNETHIIRAIEYWDIERRRWPQRQHFAVLIAESITRRFFNVIQLLSLSIPIIAIQVNVIEADGKRILHFSKILDAYEEPEDEASSSSEITDEAWWRARSLANLDAAKTLLKAVASVYRHSELSYLKNYIAVKAENSFFNQFTVRPRSGSKSLIRFWVNEADKDSVSAILDQKSIPFARDKTSKGAIRFGLTVDQKLIDAHVDLFKRIAQFVKKEWFGEGVLTAPG